MKITLKSPSKCPALPCSQVSARPRSGSRRNMVRGAGWPSTEQNVRKQLAPVTRPWKDPFGEILSPSCLKRRWRIYWVKPWDSLASGKQCQSCEVLEKFRMKPDPDTGGVKTAMGTCPSRRLNLFIRGVENFPRKHAYSQLE